MVDRRVERADRDGTLRFMVVAAFAVVASLGMAWVAHGAIPPAFEASAVVMYVGPGVREVSELSDPMDGRLIPVNPLLSRTGGTVANAAATSLALSNALERQDGRFTSPTADEQVRVRYTPGTSLLDINVRSRNSQTATRSLNVVVEALVEDLRVRQDALQAAAEDRLGLEVLRQDERATFIRPARTRAALIVFALGVLVAMGVTAAVRAAGALLSEARVDRYGIDAAVRSYRRPRTHETWRGPL